MSADARAVAEDEAGIRLDRWLRRQFPALTQGVIERLCRTGQVRVDGRRVVAATRLAPGQAVRVPPLPAAPAPPSPAADPTAAAALAEMVLYRDDKLMVLDKPPGLPTQGGPGITRHLDAMLAALPGRGRLVHRLDRETSGVLVVALTPGVAAKLAAAFRTRAVEKTYWAVVVGRPVPVAGRIDRPLVRLGPDAGAARVALAEGQADAARAITDYLYARPRRPPLRLAGAAPADRPDAPAAGALRGAGHADPGRPRLRRGGGASGGICRAAAPARAPARAAASGRGNARGGGRVARAHAGDVPRPRLHRASPDCVPTQMRTPRG